jgi:isoleucyl-tRNA synthetase
VFTPLPGKPDHPALELETLDLWEREGTFAKLREQISGGPRFSFVDGPVTANKKLGVHTAWGRTLKDVFQRYKAMRGFDQRFQNGFDCQGLWIEVGVEKSLGLNSKREIEEYGLGRFTRECTSVVEHYIGELTRGSIRLGQWMDWGNDYATFSDTNIEYIWRFLKLVHERGWLCLGHRSTDWCPRCGTSLSQHELSQAGVYQERADPSLFVRLPLLDRHGESLVVWTTTPWTLPANVAAAVRPNAEYGLTDEDYWVAVARYPDETFTQRLRGEELVGWRYQGPFDTLGPGSAVEHRVIPWDDVTLDQGTGIVHIAPGCGAEDFELSKVNDLPVLMPVDEAGRFYDDYGWLHGKSTLEAADQIVGDLGERGLLVEAGLYQHAYPHCWRCDTPLIFRIADDWLIAVDEIRPQLLEANATVEWTPAYYAKRMEDWLRNMGDWNISRRRYYGLPLPIYPCDCGHVNVVGSRAELEQRAVRGLEQLEELHRPWIDEVVITCEQCGEEVRRIPEVGDVWLDAGIVPFSTLGWRNPEWGEHGYATGASARTSRADLPDHAYWEQWFPADWVSEMREQIRLWFYSQLFMSVALVGRAPFKQVLGYEKMLDEHGREMHGSWGNLILAEDAFDRMGADVMRWQYCQQTPDRNILFGYGPAHEIKRRFLRFWNSVKFFVDSANAEGFRPAWVDAPAAEHVLDRWLVARTQQLAADATQAYEEFLSFRVVEAFESYMEDLSNWYIRRSRPRFYSYDEGSFGTLWWSIVQSLRVIAPLTPFLADHLWRNLVPEGAPESVHLAGWPELGEPDASVLAEMAGVRRVAELGHQARGEAGIALRQPLRRMFVRGASAAAAHVGELASELNVKEVLFDEGPVARIELKPNLPVLGPRLGAKLREVSAALAAGEYEELGEGGVRVAGEKLRPDDVIRGERLSVDGFVMANDDVVSVALSTELDDELRREKRVRDLIRAINQMRKDAGLDITDRIVAILPAADADLVDAHGDWIKQETLAIELRVDGAALAIEKVG